MTVIKRGIALVLCAGLLAGCSGMTQQQQRMLSGGAIGAGGGAVISALVGGPIWLGAVAGGAAGTAVGAVMH